MTKIWKAAAAIGCTAVMVIGLSACDFSLFGNNSKSAYQVAVENGFQGSEEDWLKSLHGADGKDGGDLDIEEIYAAAAKNGYEGSFLEFNFSRNTFPPISMRTIIPTQSRTI